MRNLDELRDDAGNLPAYAWPGGYAMAYLCADGGELCAGCANGGNGSEASTNSDAPDDWRLISYVAYGADCDTPTEGVNCDHCNTFIVMPESC